MQTRLSAAWLSVLEVGIELATESERQKIQRSNSMAWFNAVCGLLFAPIYFFILNAPAAAAVISIMSVLGLFVVVLNAAGFGLAARYFQSFYFTASILAVSFYLGAESGVTLLYLPALTVVFLNFDHREKRSLVFVLCGTIAIAISGDIYIETSEPVIRIAPSYLPFLRVLTRLAAMSILISQLFVFARSLMRAQARLASTSESVVAMLGSLQDAFYFVDRSWKIVHVNATTQEALKRAGLPNENLAGRHYFEMNSYMRKQHFAEELLKTMAEKSSFHGEYYSPQSRIWVELRADANDFGMSIVYRDITKRKAAEAKLQQDEQLQAAIFNQAATGLFLVSLDGYFVRVNQEMTRLLGYSEGELLQMTFWDILVENSENDARSFSMLIDGSLKLYQGERYYRHKNGTSVPFNVQVSAIRSVDNVAEFLVVSLQDLSVAKEAEQKLVQASKMSSLGEMAGSIAHEINNPMTIISLSAEQLEIAALDEQVDASEISRISTRIQETVSRVTKIIRGLKAFSRNAEHDPMTLNSVSSVVEDSLELCREKFRNKGVELRVGHLPELTLLCRPTEISQVLLNLLGNAFDAIESREGEKWVMIDAVETDYRIQIQVTDCGDGIPESVAQRMLEPFFTTKALGKGTGLGLSISKGIIESHGGRLYLDHGCKNTRFVVELEKAGAASTIAAPKINLVG